jgi:hypothetical protein
MVAASVGACQLGKKEGADPPDDATVMPPLASAAGDGAMTPPPAPEAPLPPAALTGLAAENVRFVDRGGRTLADGLVTDCAMTTYPARELRLSVSLASSFGDAQVRFTVKDALGQETVTAEVDGQRLFFPSTAPLAGRLTQQACAVLTRQLAMTHDVQVDEAVVTELGAWLAEVAPDCEEIAPAGDAWICRLEGAEPSSAREELLGIQAAMARRWSRQPYLLAHRVAVATTLASALAESKRETRTKKLDSFCRVALASLPVELPATLASARWQQAVCGPRSPAREPAARFGLAKSLTEIDVLSQLFERTSRLGFLTLRLPPAPNGARDVLVSLTPEADVAANLVRSSGGAADATQAPACWHPVYTETPQLLRLARRLGLTGTSPRATCAADGASRDGDGSAQRYFAESITSETEFVLTNGRAKTLRLPVGTYGYTLRALPEDRETWDDVAQADPDARGSITWDDRRPHPVIAAW